MLGKKKWSKEVKRHVCSRRDDEPSAGGMVELPHELGDERMFRVSHPLRVDLENGLPVDLDLFLHLHLSSARNRALFSLVSPKKRKKTAC